MTATAAAVVLGLLAAALAVALFRSRRALRQSRQRVRSATRELEETQESFSRFAPRRVVERVLRDGLAHTAERRVVTILFADLCGFTRMSGTMDPDVLVGILNRYFARASRAITDHRGHVSKFIGDGVLALFGAIEHDPWQARDAVLAGLALVDAVSELGDEHAREGLPRLEVAVGIHRGEVIAGVVGSSELVEFTALGHHVNLASRVEGLTRKLEVPLLITSAVRDELGEGFELEEMPATEVKGIEEPVVTFAVRRAR